MTTTTDENINMSVENPIERFRGKVLGILAPDGRILRGRLINYDATVLWVEKRNGDLVMVRRDSIVRLWESKDLKRVV